jgi:hypothetical protein
MKKKTMVLTLFTLVIVSILSGCTDGNYDGSNNPSNVNAELLDDIQLYHPVSYTGSMAHSLVNGVITLDIPADAITEDVKITVKTAPNMPTDSSYDVISSYDFGPDGTVFNEDLTLTIKYDQSNLPQGSSEENLGLYTVENSKYVKVSDSIVDSTLDIVKGTVSHFSYYMIACPSDTTDDGSDDNSSDEDPDSSAVYMFDVPIQIMEKTYMTYDTVGPRAGLKRDETFFCQAYFAWDPQPYVRYYEVYFHINGSEPTGISIGKTWREQTETWWGQEPSINTWENKYIEIGDYETVPTKGSYLGRFDELPIDYETWNGENLSEKHGFGWTNMYDLFSTDPTNDDEVYVTDEEIEVYKTEIRDFIQEYVKGWYITVRAIS